jgi:hypothetical protein
LTLPLLDSFRGGSVEGVARAGREFRIRRSAGVIQRSSRTIACRPERA